MLIPTIDPSVRYVGTSYLRQLNAETLKSFDGAVVVRDASDQPLVVIVAYETYLRLQQAAQSDRDERLHAAFCGLSTGHFGVCRKKDKEPSKRERI